MNRKSFVLFKPLKTHYIHGCPKGRIPEGHGYPPVTSELSKVDCKNCLRQIAQRKLQPRSNFPEIPTFDVKVEDRYYYVFRCPVCRTKITHHSKSPLEPGK